MGIFSLLSLVIGILSFFLLPIIFGPTAVILGSVGLSRKEKYFWIGFLLGCISTLYVVAVIESCRGELENLNRFRYY